MFGLATIILIPFSFYEMIEMREYLFKKFPQKEKWPELSDLKWCAAGALVSFIVWEIMNYLTYDFFYRNCKEQNDEEIRKARTLKAVKCFFSGSYYFACSIWGFILLRNEYYMPAYLGCNGDMSLLETKFGEYNGPTNYEIYFLGTMGYHFLQMCLHMHHKARNDFIEMFVHHITTVFLYWIGFYSNRIESSLLIMYLHDIADVPTNFGKCFVETIFKNTLQFCIFTTLILWGYTRVFLLPQFIYIVMQMDLYEGQFKICIYFTGIMLLTLQILHIYWYFMIINAVITALKKQNIEDTTKIEKEKEQ